MRVKCIAQEHNTMSPARDRSIGKQRNIESTKPLEVLRQPSCYCCPLLAHHSFSDFTFVFSETVSLADAAHREVQRRTEASVDHAAGLPPDVVAVLTMFDALERQKEEAHNSAHKRFADSINRFFDKLQTEETKYNNRMDELQVGLF